MSTFLLGVLAGYGIAIPVGAIAVLIVQVGIRCGFRCAASAGAGAATADLAYSVLAVTGGVALADVIGGVGEPFRWASAAALVAMAGLGLYNARREPVPASVDTRIRTEYVRTYFKFLGLTIINPMTVVYFVAVVLGLGLADDLSAFQGGLFVTGAFLADPSCRCRGNSGQPASSSISDRRRRGREPCRPSHGCTHRPEIIRHIGIGTHPIRGVAGGRRGLVLPPLEHPQRPERYPPRGSVQAVVDVEPGSTLRIPVERRGAVLQAPGADMVNRLAQPGVRRHAGQNRRGAEVVQRAEHVVVPSIGMEKVEVSLVGRFACGEPTEQGALQEILLSGKARRSRLGRAAGCLLVFQESFENVDRGVERRTDRAVLGLAVPAAIIQALPNESLYHRGHVYAEVGAVGKGHTIDARFDLPLPVGLMVMLPAAIGADQLHHTPGPIRARIEPELAKLGQ